MPLKFRVGYVYSLQSWVKSEFISTDEKVVCEDIVESSGWKYALLRKLDGTCLKVSYTDATVFRTEYAEEDV